MVPREPGQYARERFTYLFRATLVLLGGSYAISLAIGILLKPNWWHIYAITIPIVCFLFLLTFQRSDLEELRRSLLSWRKGAIGEERVGASLKSLEARGYRTLHDIQTSRGNLDHVVVGPTGVFLIETKSHEGRIWLAKGGRLMKGNYDVEAWVTQAQRGALEVKDRLRRVGLGSWVEAVIVLTRNNLNQPIRKKVSTIIEAGELIEFIERRRGASLDEAGVALAVAAISSGNQT